MDSRSTVLFAGGGTGGHLFPGIAIAQELLRRDPASRVVFIGSTRAIESTIVAEQGFEHRMLPVESLPMLKRNPLKFVYRNWQAWHAATRLLREFNPTAVVGLGGYASAPLVWAASRHRVPVILLEQNVIPGRTTRWLSRCASHVCVTFAQTSSQLPQASNVIVTGNAIRSEITALHPRIRSNTSPPELLILGGSQGADSLNEAVLFAVRQLSDSVAGWSVVHQTGPRQVDRVREEYNDLGITACVESFFHDLPSRYSTASLVVSRAGASTLTELACAGIPMILLPYPHAADDHQRANAKVFSDANAAVIVEHVATAEATGTNLATAMRSLMNDSQRLQTMGNAAKQLGRPNAAERIADVVTNAIGQT
jgi:UDP-N-acetylglucosamine--N-acetylmuramyl-(pentapeptide) pyrophosphoryl-undecaprenol N-acetylglucosamine transferase